MNWVERINSVMEYIEENLGGKIDAARISFIFASPQGMFQRIFANITDMTLSEYIRKRRLTQAVFDLRDTDERIIDIALKYEYSSASAFSYAFKKYHGITPSMSRKSDIQLKSFQRFAFTLILSENGVESMKYYNIENAEFIMKQIVNKDHKLKFLRAVSEHNGIKCSCDGYRALVILPKTSDDWNMSDTYLNSGNKDNPRFSLHQIFNSRNDNSLRIVLSKEQAAVLLASFDGVKINFKRNFVSLKTTDANSASHDVIVCMDINTMGIITEATSVEMNGTAGKPVMSFYVRFIEDALKFAMCSDNGNVEIYYNGNLSPLIIRSGRLYAAVLPVILRDEPA